MNASVFAQSVRPKPVRVLRLHLLPYSIGHELILRAENNALTKEGFKDLPINQQIAALAHAALVCSRPYSKRNSKISMLCLWEWSLRKLDFKTELQKFIIYKIDGSLHPPIPDDEAFEMANGKQSGRKLGSGLLERILNCLAGKEKSYGFKSVYDFPLGMAYHLYFTGSEQEGVCAIENDREKQIKDEMAEHRKFAEENRESLEKQREAIEQLRKGNG